MSNDTFPWSHKVDGDRIADQEKKLLVEPDAPALKRIAAAYELDGIERLSADLTLKPWGKRGVRVVGKLKADLNQTCVVTLEPFVTRLEDEIDRSYLPASSRPRRPRDLNDEGEIEIDLETLDPPDVMMDGVLDLGALICEQLALNIDPFPRKPGVVFETEADAEGDAEPQEEKAPNAFAALAKLKDPSAH
ncbi:YceD family protein [Roseibium aestuarii]|uniref:YceD family protein n=1 Tax=Roseibium aestuarii TaxID=2600299 RepID=A0ABW4JRA8_9HYPH|nr:DUF177 domain-containing protein [Roseibium aestuarii]